MQTFQNKSPLAPVSGVIFFTIGILAFVISGYFTIAYFSDITKEHHGTPVFMGISLIVIFTGTLMLFGKQTIAIDQTKVSKTLTLFKIKLVYLTADFTEIHRIETAKQSDIRIIKNNHTILILDSLQPDQFKIINKSLTANTSTPT